MTRAVLEGVAFGLRDGLDQMIAAGMPEPTQIRASGGGIASPTWRQILADVLGAEIATVDTTEGAAYGAGLLAAVGAGWYPTVDAATAALVTATPVAAPGADAAAYADDPRDLSRPVSGAGADLPPPGRLRAASVRSGPRARPGARPGPPARGYPRSSIASLSFSVTSSGFLPRMIMPSTSSAVTLPLSTVSTIRP